MNDGSSHVSFLGEFDFLELFSVGHHVLVLDTHNTTTPGSSESFVVVELSSEVLGKEFQILVVFLSHFGKSDAGGSLGVDELSESCLSLDEGVGDSLLSAEGWEEDQEFNWVNIMSHNDELGFTFFNELGNVVETVFNDDRLGRFLGISITGLGLSFFLKSGFLLFFGLWLVFSK